MPDELGAVKIALGEIFVSTNQLTLFQSIGTIQNCAISD